MQESSVSSFNLKYISSTSSSFNLKFNFEKRERGRENVRGATDGLGLAELKEKSALGLGWVCNW